MPPVRYNEKLTHLEAIALFDDGIYTIDFSTGNITSTKTKRVIFESSGGRHRNPASTYNKPYRWVRLYSQPKHIFIPIAHLVWILHTRSPVPPGYEIHHFDEDPANNTFDNLLCCHPLDHKKFHNENQKNQTPF